MSSVKLGVIGGSGFYQIEGLEAVEQVELITPFGAPSDVYYRGRLGGSEIVFLSRHGRGHRILPSELNYRANIYGMKHLGVELLVSVSTAGSMKEHIAPGDLAVISQFVDHTYQRRPSFFGNGIVAHVSLADPVCTNLSHDLAKAARSTGGNVHENATYLCIEGPQFSTRAESSLYRSWGVDVISMTAMQEARLAREAELCYSVLALVTDYDCWHQSAGAVDIREILRVMKLNVAVAQRSIAELARLLPNRPRECGCADALKGAIITDPAVIPAETTDRLRPIIGKYLR
jgi:5'-methylthioadenosine phosphorylase